MNKQNVQVCKALVLVLMSMLLLDEIVGCEIACLFNTEHRSPNIIQLINSIVGCYWHNNGVASAQ